jgi:transposase InsO family protein
MGWKGVTIMDQKMQFILECRDGFFSFSELCSQFGISRKTGYKWLDRYHEEGPPGLTDRSRRPHSFGRATDSEIVDAIVGARLKHPTWGPKKLLAILSSRFPDLPAISTASDILKRNGLIQGNKRKMWRQRPGTPHSLALDPNDTWSVDYKGQFRMRNGIYCYPLTVCDMRTRYLMGIDAHDTVSLAKTKQCFTRLFREYGLPGRIRSDNGVPFASNAIARLSSLSVWWIKLGILPEQIEPGKPQQNGRHERMHRTLKKEATIPPERDIRAQQGRFDMFRREYNEIRPHESLGQKTPGSVYVSSPRRMPGKLTHFDYPQHFEVRRVSGNNSCIRFKNRFVFVSRALGGEYIGLEEIDDRMYNLYFCKMLVGRFNEEKMRVEDIIERLPLRQIYNRPGSMNPGRV